MNVVLATAGGKVWATVNKTEATVIQFEPMDDEAFAAYLAQTMDEYAAEHVRGGRWSPAEASQAARAEYDKLLPQGAQTPDNYLCLLVDEARGERVGHIWYFHDGKRERVFLYDIAIDEHRRRKGYAQQALARLEEEARALGATHIALHVFGHNTAARRLYEKAGYEVTNVNMRKWIGGRGTEDG